MILQVVIPDNMKSMSVKDKINITVQALNAVGKTLHEKGVLFPSDFMLSLVQMAGNMVGLSLKGEDLEEAIDSMTALIRLHAAEGQVMRKQTEKMLSQTPTIIRN